VNRDFNHWQFVILLSELHFGMQPEADKGVSNG
jgi:hypothetical protein